MSEYVIESRGPQFHLIPKEEPHHELVGCFCDPELSMLGAAVVYIHYNEFMRHVRGTSGADETTACVPTHDEAVTANIRAALDATHGNKADAARILGLKRTTLVEKMKKLGMM